MMNCLYAPTIYGFILFIFELWKRIPSNIYIVSPGTCFLQRSSVPDARALVHGLCSVIWSRPHGILPQTGFFTVSES